MRRVHWLVMLLAFPITLSGQTGSGSSCCSSVTPRVQAGLMTLNDESGVGGSRHEWFQAIVLWRTRSTQSGGYPSAETGAFERERDLARIASRELGRQHLGGVLMNRYYYAEYDRDHLWALDQEFLLPRRDSALVVMIDGLDTPSPRAAAYAYISAEMPDNYWGKTWTSGDTTFMIHPRNTAGLLLEALRASPVVRAFLDESSRR